MKKCRRRPDKTLTDPPDLPPFVNSFLRDNRVVKKTGARATRKKRRDGAIVWRDADRVIFKIKFPEGQIARYDADGLWHRDNGPAIEEPELTAWCQHGKEHREGAPAVESATGKYWYRYGKLHRDDGPAVLYADGRTEWWHDDRRLTPEEIRAVMKEKGDKAAEPFLKGLDHEVTPFKQFKFKKP